MIKVATIIGARPQFIKAAVVSRALREYRPDIKETIIHTGQHYDANMSDIFFDELDIPSPDFNLGIGGGTHGQNTGRMLEEIESVLLKNKPDWLLVYGDTDSTLAGALAASKLNIPVAHVEAGLRSFNRQMPEELNRILTDHISTLLFSPTKLASSNLANEGIASDNIRLVGDVMYDAALYYRAQAKQPSTVSTNEEFILATLHRAENTDNLKRLANIINALNEIAQDIQVFCPLHPRTYNVLNKSGFDTSNITFFEPVGYLEMIWLLEHCKMVVTDSGGLQKEAYFFCKPCIITRDQTEWVELVEMKCNILVNANKPFSIKKYRNLLFPELSSNLYGSGVTGKEIALSL